MGENNPAGLERAEIERVVGDHYNRLLRQKHNSRALAASGSTTVGCKEEKRKPRNDLEGNCFNCGRKGHRAEDCRSVKKKIEKSGDAPADQKGRGRGNCYVCGSEEHFAHEHCGLCRSLKYQTHDCGERGVEKGAKLAEIYVPAKSEVGLVAATTGAARGNGKEEWDSDSGASFYVAHTQAGMTAYKKAPATTSVEVGDGTILPIDGFGTVDGDLNHPGTTTKPVTMVSVAYLPGFSRNLLCTREAVEQWGKPLVYYITMAVLGFLGEETLVSNFCPRKGLFFATGVRRTPSKGQRWRCQQKWLRQ